MKYGITPLTLNTAYTTVILGINELEMSLVLLIPRFPVLDRPAQNSTTSLWEEGCGHKIHVAGLRARI